MSIWGALDVTSDIAAREVLEHTVVATSARLGRATRDVARPVVLTCFVLSDGVATSGAAVAVLSTMSRAAEVLGAHVGEIHWFGEGVLVSVASDGTIESASRRAAHVTELAGASHGLRLRYGVASTDEADDPIDLVRLAIHRARYELGAVPPRRSFALPVSAGERKRLDIIAANRNREPDALLREALDLVITRHR